MLFNSYVFIFAFLPIVLAGYYILRRLGYSRGIVAWLVVASFFFYGWWNPPYTLLIFISIVFNYFVGVGLGLKIDTPIFRRRRKALLVFGVAANLAVLGYCKYANFFVDSLNTLFGLETHLGKIILPLAISFFTFTQIAYLVDAYRGLAREYRFMDYTLFVTFFPHLIAGPIVHHSDLVPEFERNFPRLGIRQRMPVDFLDLGAGLTLFILGLAKKVVLADSVSGWSDAGFAAVGHGQVLGVLHAWQTVLSYTLQIYFDFSGYSDMAIGLGLMFGIRFPLNFNSPYKAVNIADFWRRWHMTLSTFLRDYLYIPLGGNRVSPPRRYLNLMLTMLLGGLWHGAGLTFVVWGGLHGLYLVLHQLWTKHVRPPAKNGAAASPSLLGIAGARALTLIAVMIAWIFFRAEDFRSAWSMLRSMFGVNGLGGSLSIQDLAESAAILLPLTALVLWAPNTQSIMRPVRPTIDRQLPTIDPCRPAWLTWRSNLLWAIAIAILTVACMLFLSRAKTFLYFQF